MLSEEAIKQMRLDVAIEMVLSDPPLLERVLGDKKPKGKINTKVLRQLIEDNPPIKRVLEWYVDKGVERHDS